MPRRDGTGPMGYGPMTGCSCGPCADDQAFGMRRGFSRTRQEGFWGRRMGACNCYQPIIYQCLCSKESRLEALDKEERLLKEELALIQTRREAIKKEKN